MNRIRIASSLLSLAFGALVSTASSPAAAAGTQGMKADCTVTLLAYDSHLFVQCSGDPVNYYAYTTSVCASPTTVTQDTLKMWQSMLNGALLSGRKVDIYFTTGVTNCLSTPYIYNVALK